MLALLRPLRAVSSPLRKACDTSTRSVRALARRQYAKGLPPSFCSALFAKRRGFPRKRSSLTICGICSREHIIKFTRILFGLPIFWVTHISIQRGFTRWRAARFTDVRLKNWSFYIIMRGLSRQKKKAAIRKNGGGRDVRKYNIIYIL